MKATFKRTMTAIFAAAMCAVPMVSVMSASAAGIEMVQSSGKIKGDEPIYCSTMPISNFNSNLEGKTILTGNASDIANIRSKGYNRNDLVAETIVMPETKIVGTYGNGKGYLEGYNKDMVCETIVMPETKIVGTYGNGKGYLEGYNKDMVCETIVMPETKIVGTYGNGKGYLEGYNKDRVCETIVMPETKIIGTYGSNVKTQGVKEKEYLNAYNQVAGHAIKTTTVGVNSF